MYQIYWINDGVKECLHLNCTEEVKDAIMASLAPFNPECFDRSTGEEKKTIQTIKKDHKPVQRGHRYLTSQASFGLKPQGETLYTYMIPDMGYEKISEYLEQKWKAENTGKEVELIGLVWRTLDELKMIAKKCNRDKLIWLELAEKEEEYDPCNEMDYDEVLSSSCGTNPYIK